MLPATAPFHLRFAEMMSNLYGRGSGKITSTGKPSVEVLRLRHEHEKAKGEKPRARSA
jgi:hypothetical protein